MTFVEVFDAENEHSETIHRWRTKKVKYTLKTAIFEKPLAM